MSDFASEVQRPSSGCGIQGCLFAAVAIFVLLLIGMLIVSIFRFSQPPQGVPRPMSAASEEALPAFGHRSSAVRHTWPRWAAMADADIERPKTDGKSQGEFDV